MLRIPFLGWGAACLSGLLAIAAATPASADSFAYMAAGNADFGVLDLTSGAFTLCGNSGVQLAGLGAIAHGVIYAGAYGGSTVYTVNPANGTLTEVGTTGLVIDDFGSTTKALYALNTIGSLYRIDPTTAVATLLGSTGVALAGTFGLSSGSGKLYLQNGNQLYSLSVKTGKAKLIGAGSTNFGALVVSGGQLYGGSTVTPLSVYAINATTGVDTAGAPLTGETASFWGLAPTPKNATGACPT